MINPLSDEMLGTILTLRLNRIKKRVGARCKIPFAVAKRVGNDYWVYPLRQLGEASSGTCVDAPAKPASATPSAD